MLKAIFWDNDGVLVDTETLYFQANQEILTEVEINLTQDIYRTISLDQGQSVVNLARYKGFNESQIRELRQKRDDLYSRILQQGVRIFPGIIETLRALHGKIAMGIVTSSPRPHFDIIHRQTGMMPFFNLIITREDYKNAKPKPDPYLLALEWSGLKPNECLVIEDTLRGLESSKAAKIPCVIIRNDYTRDQLFNGAEIVLNQVSELLPYLKNRYKQF